MNHRIFKSRHLLLSAWMPIMTLLLIESAHAQSAETEASQIEAPRQIVSPPAGDSPVARSLSYSHGYFIRSARLSSIPGSTNVALYNPAGSLKQQLAVWPEGAVSVRVTSVDVNTSGQLVVAGSALLKDSSSLGFIALGTIGGPPPTLVNTGSYRSTIAAIASDGSVWTIGAESTDTAEAEGSWKNYNMLHHYAIDGSLRQQFLPRWGSDVDHVVKVTAPQGGDMLLAYDAEQHPLKSYTAAYLSSRTGYMGAWNTALKQTWLKATMTGMVLFDGNKSILTTYSTKQGTLLTIPIATSQLSKSLSFNGFAASDDGHIYASTLKRAAGGEDAQATIYELHLNPSAAKAEWKSTAQQALGATSVQRILGYEDGELVYGGGDGRVFWSRVLPSSSQ